MTKQKPFIKTGDRIRPLTARQFSTMVHDSPEGEVLYRIFEAKESARVSAHAYRTLDVFEGLGISFEFRKLSKSKSSLFGVYGISVTKPNS